jgi:hypothetical protein
MDFLAIICLALLPVVFMWATPPYYYIYIYKLFLKKEKNKMTKLESAKKIIEQEGICKGIFCQDCFLLELPCFIFEIERLKAAENYIKENEPRHYTEGAIECIDAIKAMLTTEEFRGY